MPRKRTGIIKESREHLLRLEKEFRGKPAEKRITMLLILQREPQRPFEEIALIVGSPAPTIKRWWLIYRGGGIEALARTKQRKYPSEDQVFLELKRKLANAELQSLDDVRAWFEARNETHGMAALKPLRATRGKGKRTLQAAEDAEPKLGAAILRFLTSLPLELDAVTWIRRVSAQLREFLGDVDRVSIIINMGSDLRYPDNFSARLAVIQGPGYKEAVVKALPAEYREANANHLERYLEDARTKIDMEQHHPPVGFTYYYSQTYVGMIILWRKQGEPPISDLTLRVMEGLQAFFLFLLTDVIARSRLARPASDFFVKAWSEFVIRFTLSLPEQRILMHLLMGYSYKDIARQMNLSENTVRYHVKSIYAKADVHGQNELFARYFTARIEPE
jgi:DNA-binding CsgD family transcriptional regulator